MLEEIKDRYITEEYNRADKKLKEFYDKLKAINHPSKLAEYPSYIALLKRLMDEVKSINLQYSSVVIKDRIMSYYADEIQKQKREEGKINEKYSNLIKSRTMFLEEEAKNQNKALKSKLDESNKVYLDLEAKRKELEQYSDKVIDMCTLYGVTSSDITINNSSFTVKELSSLYDKCINYVKRPSNRTNVIERFRDKFPNESVQGAVLVLAFILTFTFILDMAAVAGFIAILISQSKVQDRFKLYSLLLALIYNVQPLSLGFKPNVDKGQLKDEKADETDSKLIELNNEWTKEIELLNCSDKKQEFQEEIQNLVNLNLSIEEEFNKKIQLFEQTKSKVIEALEEKYEVADDEFNERKAKVKLLGQEINKSAVFNTVFKLGLKDGVLEETVDVGLSNLVIRPCSDEKLEKAFLQCLLANALCNVRANKLTVYIYDPNNFGKALTTFYDDKLQDDIIFVNDNLTKIVDELKEHAERNLKVLKGVNINEFNAEAEVVGKIEREYKLLLVLSQSNQFEKEEVLRSFMSYSASVGVFIWLLSNINIPNTFVFDKPFKGVSNPYLIDTMKFGKMVVKTLIKAKEQNKLKGLEWSKFIEHTVPNNKMWTYSGDEYIDLDPGYEEGDPEKFIGYTLGHSGDVHAIAAGATGAGKSVFLNSMIASMCQKYSPMDLELWLVDYKAVEFQFFIPKEGRNFTYPHIKTCLCTTDGDYAESVYAALFKECERRFALFSETGVKSLKDFNGRMARDGMPEKRLPRIVFINDEFQVIFEKASGKILDSIKTNLTNIAKLGRAAGVHLFFTSQSMKGTVSDDVLSQFTLRFALRCDESVSMSLLGTKKASQIKEPFGFCYARCVADKSLEAQKRWKVPFFPEDELKEPIALKNHMQECWEKAIKEKYKLHDMICYNEKEIHSIKELEAIYTKLNAERSDIPESGLFILGNRMVYSPNNKAPENIILSKESNSHIIAVFGETSDVVDFYRDTMCNIAMFKQKPQVFINAQTDNLHYLCKIDEDVPTQMLELSSPKTDIYKLTTMFLSIYEKRVETKNIDIPAYFILVGWDKAIGFGIDRDSQLSGEFATMLKLCSEVNMHFIIICSEVGNISTNIINSCKFKMCGKCDEKSSFALLDTKQGSQPSEVKDGYLYLKAGNELPSRAKLWISKKDREVKKSTLVI